MVIVLAKVNVKTNEDNTNIKGYFQMSTKELKVRCWYVNNYEINAVFAAKIFGEV